MNYRDPLPANCPPSEAEEVVGPYTVFRLVRSDPPTNTDFRSVLQKNPNLKGKVPECIARGLSVHSEKQGAEKMLRTFKRRFKEHRVCRVMLTSESGKILQTFSKSHHTWWPYAKFDIIMNCKI